MTTRVAESRRYDARYDPTYTGPYNNAASDPRVVAAASSDKMVSGQTRFKYFKRPIMPRMNAVPPYILLAPVTVQDPLQPVNFVPEPPVKDAEVQTMYRESEAQTIPYSPDFVVPEGTDPEILLLKNLTSENGLPLGKKELEMILQARIKKEVESNLPPFTDEASVALRKKLMEQQDTREFKLRENEIDAKREMRLLELQRALYERDESSEFLSSQRVEAMRQARMEDREKALQKIRNKRIKVLRRLARQRNVADPLLASGTKRDIINDYFDKSSQAYAPVKREGKDAKIDASVFDIGSRTAPLDNIVNINSLEPFIPASLTNPASAARQFSPLQALSRTAPIPAVGTTNGGGRAAQDRLTSAAQRTIRNTKRDVEEMHQILLKKKRAAVIAKAAERVAANAAAAAAAAQGAAGEGGLTSYPGTAASSASITSDQGGLLSKKPKARPPTPDLTADENGTPYPDNQELTAAVVLLQKLIRGRAVQNIMYEGRFRRRELIAELRCADEVFAERASAKPDIMQKEMARKVQRVAHVRETTLDAMAGTATSFMIIKLAHQQERMDVISEMEAQAKLYVEERRKLEAAEAGRRQREAPSKDGKKSTKSDPKKAPTPTPAAEGDGSARSSPAP